jgi:hypothetical protein
MAAAVVPYCLILIHASVDAFRCMVGPRLLPCRHHSAKADKSSLSYDQWSEM